MIFFAGVVVIGMLLMLLERIFPDQALPKVKGWWTRVIMINVLQLAVVIVAGQTWEQWFHQWSLWHISLPFPAYVMGLLAYLIITFEFYWWHRMRHDWHWAWNMFHQIHHSPLRIETITSFYKHPLEIAANSLIISGTIFFFFGFSIEIAGWLTLYMAAGEYLYHMNIRTPYLMGYIFQRPEMHRIHHQQGKHYNNFSDLPLWDILFGTFENPKLQNKPCGFAQDKENKNFWSMLGFKNALR